MKLDELWKTVKDDLQIELTVGEFNAFISPATLTRIDESGKNLIATLAVNSLWHQKMIENRFADQICEAFCRVTGKQVVIQLAHQTNGPTKIDKITNNLGPLFTHAEEDKKTYARAVQEARLRPDFTLEQFAVSSSNEMAHAAAQAVSKNPGKAYQLLFLFGGVGVGKTHLMQAIGHKVLKNNSTARVIYRSGEDFTNEIIEAIQYKSTVEFRKKYRSAAVLLIDDIQFIGGKDKVQEEFFHTFNAVHRTGGQIVLTSDQLPHEIIGLENRLRSRFEGGLTIDIQEPTFELRTAILLIKSTNIGFELPMDVAQLVAANIESTRKLEGFLTRLMVESRAKREPVTLEMAEQLLGVVKGQDHKTNIIQLTAKPNEILQTVSEVFSVKLSVLKGKRRKKEVILPRHLAMYLLRTELGTPLEEIGTLLGGRDHTTVIHAVDKITVSLPNDERLRGSLAEIRKRLRFAEEVIN